MSPNDNFDDLQKPMVMHHHQELDSASAKLLDSLVVLDFEVPEDEGPDEQRQDELLVAAVNDAPVEDATRSDHDIDVGVIADVMESQMLLNKFRQNIDTAELIAKQFASISLSEQQRVYEDVYGTDAIVEETQNFVYAKLCDLDIELGQISHKPGYDVAVQENAEYINSRTLRLKFLRAEDFDSFRAAHRIVAWCNMKLDQFGKGTMGRDLRLSDLTPEAQHVLRSGKFQCLPQPDSAGRNILFLSKNRFGSASCTSIMQVVSYITERMIESDDVQRKGAVCVHNFDVPHDFSIPNQRKTRLYESLHMTGLVPLKVQAFHYFGNASETVKDISHIVQLSLSKKTRFRFRSHFGNLQDNLVSLAVYGIPSKDLPLDHAGEVDIGNHMRWMIAQQFREGCGMHAHSSLLLPCIGGFPPQPTMAMVAPSRSGTTVIQQPVCVGFRAASKSSAVIPTDGDILMGRGSALLQHPGNKYFRSLIAELFPMYNAANRTEKYQITKDVIERIRQNKGGRFLRRRGDDGGWEEAPWSVAREKAAHAFRKKRELRQKAK
eukprot:CAMPEP_0119546672 /NCGR_PEP_ID=MMETSP1352-20130426/984_1 /TAXON_ID=265584 /ORGANISM="Stauroneis constricta, Strain CCMP1120" /LENGTH=548 /DNA_ID=CAMNT_0007591393 /DNA_START=53 /DNA_END=1699 /DNA_ORIENTATION=+